MSVTGHACLKLLQGEESDNPLQLLGMPCHSTGTMSLSSGTATTAQWVPVLHYNATTLTCAFRDQFI